MFCYQCGAENISGVKFCGKCGVEQQSAGDETIHAKNECTSYLPQFERTSDNELSRAEVERDRIYSALERLMQKHLAEIQILKSGPYEAQPWVHAEAWVPHPSKPQMMSRRTLRINVRSCSFQRFPIERDIAICEVRFNNSVKNKRISNVIELDDATIEQFFLYLIAKREKGMSGFSLICSRQWGIDLWRPNNRVMLLKRFDFFSIGLQTLFFLGVFTLQLFGLGVVFWIVGVLLWWRRRSSPAYTLKSGFPVQEPRRLARLDSWQTVINQLGAAKDLVRKEILTELDLTAEKGFQAEIEKIWYVGLRGKEEREQLVIRYKRSMAFIHIYQYEKDLYVAWDAHLNRGVWNEKVLVSGVHAETNSYCRLVVPEHGWKAANEYDLTDANCLIERLHSVVTRVIRRQIALYHIDQEIDFSIMREHRRGLATRSEQDSESGGKSMKSTFAKRFARKS